jgi:glutaredoxin-related protein
METRKKIENGKTIIVMDKIAECPQCNYMTNIVGDMPKHKKEKHNYNDGLTNNEKYGVDSNIDKWID